MRKFNTEGPVVARKHYCVPPLQRVDLDKILGLIQDERYFVLHAPRQTGKTSTLLALRDPAQQRRGGQLSLRLRQRGGRPDRARRRRARHAGHPEQDGQRGAGDR